MTQTEQVKRAQMDLLAEVDHFLTCGTLLGTIRHNDFISWYDDLDIALMRSDYDRMLNIMKTELAPTYFMHDWNSDPVSPHSFTKLKIRGTHYPEGLTQGSETNDSIYIDIFPYDFAPDKNCSKDSGYSAVFAEKDYVVAVWFRS